MTKERKESSETAMTQLQVVTGGKKRPLRKLKASFFGEEWSRILLDGYCIFKKYTFIFCLRINILLSQIQSCETCLQKEDKRNFLAKKARTNETNDDTSLIDLPAIETRNPPTYSALEKVQSTVKELERMLNLLQENEQCVLSMASKADQDIDDVLDHILSQIIKMISKKKKEMKGQVCLNNCLLLFSQMF